MAKLLVVFGATGNQGGSVANAVLSDPDLSQKYSVRAITRSASNPKADELKAKGAEIVEADVDKPETLTAALEGAKFVYIVTNTQYQGNTREIETRQAKAVCEAALNAGAEYIIWSSMSHPFKISNGVLKHAQHFDDKAEIEEYIRSLPIKSAHVAPASFMQNFQTPAFQPHPSHANDGTYVLGNLCGSDSKVPLIDITDTGKWVSAILADPDKYEGKFFAAAHDLYSWEEIAETMSKVTGKTVKHVQIPDEVHKGFMPESLRDMLYDMWLLIRDYGYYGQGMAEKIQWSNAQARGTLTGLEEFLKKVNYKLE